MAISPKYVVKSSKLTNFAMIFRFFRMSPYSLMDRISDSGSDGCGSIPHGGTKKETHKCLLFYLKICDQHSYDAEYVYHVCVWKFEIGEGLLVLGYEGKAFSVIDNLSEEHTL